MISNFILITLKDKRGHEGFLFVPHTLNHSPEDHADEHDHLDGHDEAVDQDHLDHHDED